MATGYVKIKRERLLFKIYLDKPIEERKIGNYAVVINGNLYLALGAHYIMFRFEKELDNSIKYQSVDNKYYTDIWNKIISIDRLDASYNPSYNRLGDGIIDFTIYISLDEWSHYELVMAMDMYYNPVDVIC
jgi:hypothetical protein